MTSSAFFTSASIRASIERWICRSTSPPSRIRLRRKSSSCSAKCSFIVSVLPLPPEGLGREYLEVLLVHSLFAFRGHRLERDSSVEHAFEEIPFSARLRQLGFAVGACRNREVDAARPDFALDAGDELPVAPVEGV